MLQGKVKAALRLLSNNSRGQVIDLEETVPPSSPGGDDRMVRDVLKDKHSLGRPAVPDALVTSEPPPTHPVIFEKITGSAIRSAALHCQGAAGLSGLDAAS